MAAAAVDVGPLAPPTTGAGSGLLWGEWARLGSVKAIVPLARTMRKKNPPNDTLRAIATSPTTARYRSVPTVPTPLEDRVQSGTEVAGGVIDPGPSSAK